MEQKKTCGNRAKSAYGNQGEGSQDRTNSLKINFWAGYSWDIRDPHVGISLTPVLGCPGQKLYARCLFLVVLDREWPGCPAIWVGTSWDQKNFMQENFGLIFGSLGSFAEDRCNSSDHLQESAGLKQSQKSL